MFGRWPREGVNGSVRAPLALKGGAGEEVEVSGEEEAGVGAGVGAEVEVVGGSAWDDDPGIASEVKSAALLRCTSEDMRSGGCSRTWPVPDALLLLLCVVNDPPPPTCALYRREPMLGDEEPDSAGAGCVVVGSSTPLNRASTLPEGATMVWDDNASGCW